MGAISVAFSLDAVVAVVAIVGVAAVTAVVAFHFLLLNEDFDELSMDVLLLFLEEGACFNRTPIDKITFPAVWCDLLYYPMWCRK